MIKIKPIICFVLFIPSICFSDISGKVIKISDGDTIWVMHRSEKIKVRMLGIDAPELNQAFGLQSKKILKSLIYLKIVHIEGQKKDRYSRLIGKVILNDQDINIKMIQKGAAWHFKRYQDDQTVNDRINYSLEERNAKKKKLGLWESKNPFPPWQWRKNRKH